MTGDWPRRHVQRALHERVADELGAPVVSSWGLTEVLVVTSGRLTDSVEKPRSTEGRPLPGVEVRVVDSHGESTSDRCRR